jgi:hypothetical protein
MFENTGRGYLLELKQPIVKIVQRPTYVLHVSPFISSKHFGSELCNLHWIWISITAWANLILILSGSTKCSALIFCHGCGRRDLSVADLLCLIAPKVCPKAHGHGRYPFLRNCLSKGTEDSGNGRRVWRKVICFTNEYRYLWSFVRSIQYCRFSDRSYLSWSLWTCHYRGARGLFGDTGRMESGTGAKEEGSRTGHAISIVTW